MFTPVDDCHCDDIAKGKSRDLVGGPSSADAVSGPTFRVGSGAMLQQLLDASCRIAQLASRNAFLMIVVQLFHSWTILPCLTQWKRFHKYRIAVLTVFFFSSILLMTTTRQTQTWTSIQKTFRQTSTQSSDSRRELRADFMTPQRARSVINTEVSSPYEMPASGAGPVSGSDPRGSLEVKASGAGPVSGSDPRFPSWDRLRWLLEIAGLSTLILMMPQRRGQSARVPDPPSYDPANERTGHSDSTLRSLWCGESSLWIWTLDSNVQQ